MYAKDPYEDKYQFLVKKRESIGLKYFNDPKAFIEYSNDMNDVYKNINDCNSDKENKILLSYNNNNFKISAPTWNEKFTLPDGSYLISDIQDYFEYI